MEIDFQEKMEPNVKIKEELMIEQGQDPLNCDEKPYHCKLCDHRCRSKHTLRSHISRIHEGKIPASVQCPLCERTCTSKSSLNVHIQTVHEG